LKKGGKSKKMSEEKKGKDREKVQRISKKERKTNRDGINFAKLIFTMRLGNCILCGYLAERRVRKERSVSPAHLLIHCTIHNDCS
jgi:hypothetical protein